MLYREKYKQPIEMSHWTSHFPSSQLSIHSSSAADKCKQQDNVIAARCNVSKLTEEKEQAKEITVWQDAHWSIQDQKD